MFLLNTSAAATLHFVYLLRQTIPASVSGNAVSLTPDTFSGSAAGIAGLRYRILTAS